MTPQSPIAPDMTPLLLRSGLKPLRIGGRELLPLVQGGMGIGVSAHRLAGSVAALGAVGTISKPPSRPSTTPTWRRWNARSRSRAACRTVAACWRST